MSGRDIKVGWGSPPFGPIKPNQKDLYDPSAGASPPGVFFFLADSQKGVNNRKEKLQKSRFDEPDVEKRTGCVLRNGGS